MNENDTIEPPSYLPIRTLVKFYRNHLADHEDEAVRGKAARNRIVSKTLGKTLVIDSGWFAEKRDRIPHNGEFWLVDVVHETRVGRRAGVFIARPIRPVDRHEIIPLVPGMFREHRHGDLLVLEPNHGGVAWYMPLNHRRAVPEIYAAIVQQ